MIEAALVQLVQADPDLSAAVGMRVHPATVPWPARLGGADALPRVTFQRVGTTRRQHNGGPIATASARIDWNVWATTHAQARELADKLRELLDGRTGVWDVAGIGRIRLRSSIVDGDVERRGDEVKGRETVTQGVTLEQRAQWDEPAT